MIPDYDWPKEEAVALKAVWDGGADPALQRRVISHLVELICGINRIPLAPGEPDITAFNCGRAWVARQLQLAITMPLDRLVKQEEPHAGHYEPISTTELVARRSADRRTKR
jgi:hypothetical protein